MYKSMVVSILFTYTKLFTTEKQPRSSGCATPFKKLNGPNTNKIRAKTKTVLVGLVFWDLLEKISNTDMSHPMQVDISRKVNVFGRY